MQKTKKTRNSKLNIRIKKPVFIILFFLLLCINLPASELVALHPFRPNPIDSDEVENIAEIFFELIQRAIPNVTGNYSTFPIDLTRLPPDVPEGGFPPFICPSPSITRGAAYALTGEVAIDYDFPGNYRLRVYLWKLDGAALLGSDELSAAGRVDAERIIPNFLEWVFSWIVSPPDPETILIYMDGEGLDSLRVEHMEVENLTLNARERGGLFSGIIDPHWLHIGVHGGVGYSVWAYARNPLSPGDGLNEMANLMAFSFGVSFSSDLMRFLRLTTEINFSMNMGALEGGHYSFMYLSVPIIPTFVLQYNFVEIGIYGGINMLIPVFAYYDGSGRNFNYRPSFPGFLFGLNFGLSLGPGTMFLDARFNYDARWGQRSSYDEVYYRISNIFRIGYRWAFFPK